MATVKKTKKVMKKDSNGGVLFLTSDTPTAVAEAVWAHTRGKITFLNLVKNIGK